METTETVQTEEPEARSEPFKQTGCTLLTILVVLILVCSAIYFVLGLTAMIMRTVQTVI